MKNIELIDKAIDDLGGEFKPAGNYVVIEESILAIAHINANLQPICTRAEFLARKAERQNKPDWSDHDYSFIQQGKNGQWYGSKSYCPPALPDYLTGDDWHYINIASSRNGEVIGDSRDTLEYRPAVTESDWPDENRIDVVATNGNDGLHYDWHARGELPPVGAMVDIGHSELSYGNGETGEVVGHFVPTPDKQCQPVAIVLCSFGFGCFIAKAMKPAKTERAKFIEAALSAAGDYHKLEDILGDLFDAGFRQPDQK